MDRQSSNVREIHQSPLRDYAREAIAAVKTDQTVGVLTWRIATHIASRVLSMPSVDLDNLPPGSAEFYLGLARTAIALVNTIDTEAPPTPMEILHYEHRRSISFARSRVRCVASTNNHRLGIWRSDPDRPGVELVRCLSCAAGASLNLTSADTSISDALLATCPQRRG